jgi:hypothetical protein
MQKSSTKYWQTECNNISERSFTTFAYMGYRPASQHGLEALPSQPATGHWHTVVNCSNHDLRGNSPDGVCAAIDTASAVACKRGCSTGVPCTGVYAQSAAGAADSVQQPLAIRLPVPEMAERGNAKAWQLHCQWGSQGSLGHWGQGSEMPPLVTKVPCLTKLPSYLHLLSPLSSLFNTQA